MGAVAVTLFLVFPLGIWDVIMVLETRTGLIQRLFAVNALLWFFLLSLRLFRTSSAPADSPSRTISP